MVRFFGKPRRDATATGAKRAQKTAPSSAPAKPAPQPREPVKLEALPAVSDDPTPVPRRRRTTRPARPPRRDWAAEAAATPVEAPAPPPASLATGEGDENAPAPAKRRRGTRGGRGRKRTTAAQPEPAVAEPAPQPATRAPRRKAEPLTLEAAVAQQAAALETFTREVTGTLRTLQGAVSELQHQLARRPAAESASRPRVGLFVDVPNVIYAAERRNITLDFGRVLEYFTRDRELVRATAYAPISDDPAAKLESQRFAHHFLGHPYRLVTKPLKRFADGSMKANFDIELAVDILTMSDRLDVVVLMSGDGDFRRVVDLVASRGVRVEVVAFSETASSELKTVADLYIDIGAHLDAFRAQK